MSHHSVSSTQTYLRCPQRYEFKYVQRLEPPAAADAHSRGAAAYGRVLHSALQAAYEQHKHCSAGSCSTMDLHFTAARAAIERAWEEEGLSPHGGDMYAAIERIQGVLEALDAPNPADVVGVEQRAEVDSPAGARLKGFLDLVLRVDSDAIVVWDWKVTGNRLTHEALVADYQMNLYAYAVRQMFPWAKRVYLVHYYPTKKSEVRVAASPDHEDDAMATFEATVEMIESDSAFEPRPGEQCGGCDFQSVCPAWTNSEGVEAQDAMKGF